jgi:hypothetical protein
MREVRLHELCHLVFFARHPTFQNVRKQTQCCWHRFKHLSHFKNLNFYRVIPGRLPQKATLHDNKSQAQVLVMLSANVRVHPDTSTGARVENRPLSPTNVPSALLPGDGRPPTAWTEVQLGDEPEKKHAPLCSEASLQPGALESICLL